MALPNQGASVSNLSDEVASEVEDEVRIVLPSSNYKDVQVILNMSYITKKKISSVIYYSMFHEIAFIHREKSIANCRVFGMKWCLIYIKKITLLKA